MVTFLWSSTLNVKSMSCSSWELPQKNPKHANLRILSTISRKSCGASILKLFFSNSAFKSKAPVFCSAPFLIFLVSNRGSYPFKGYLFWELSFKQMKNAITHCIFEHETWSYVELSIGKWNQVPNQYMFRKHRILRIKIKPLFLGLFLCRSELNLHISLSLMRNLPKSRGALSWDWTP